MTNKSASYVEGPLAMQDAKDRSRERFIPLKSPPFGIHVRENADGTIHVRCDACRGEWDNLSDTSWPDLHKGAHRG